MTIFLLFIIAALAGFLVNALADIQHLQAELNDSKAWIKKCDIRTSNLYLDITNLKKQLHSKSEKKEVKNVRSKRK